MTAAPHGRGWGTLSGGEAGGLAVVFLVGCAAAAICTRIARPFRLGRQASVEAAPASGTV